MTNFLLEKYPNETKDAIDKLKAGGDSKPSSLVVAKNSLLGSENDEMSDSDSSVDTNESVASDNASPKPPARKIRRRESICAEKITASTLEASELKVIEKSEEEKTRILDILKNNVFFSHLDPNQMETIQNAMFSVEKVDGDTIIQQGDDGDNFYIIDSGSVEVFIKSKETGDSSLVKTCEAGDAFGELAILYSQPRAASCIATGDVRLWALDRVSFNVILMKTTISKRENNSELLHKTQVFSKLTEYELLTIADTLQEETFEDGTVICNEGDSGDKFFLVKEGTAVCTKEQKEVARLCEGSYFGEVALLTNKKRQARVRAEGTLICLTLDRMVFHRVMGPLEEILLRNISHYHAN